MSQSGILQLSIGDVVPEHRFAEGAFCGTADLSGKAVRFDLTGAAVKALAAAASPIVVELELYFSCLVRKQVRFREYANALDNTHATPRTRVTPGLFATFRAVTTSQCKIADVEDAPPVEALPLKKADLFVPDWVRIDYRGGSWRGEYGFERDG